MRISSAALVSLVLAASLTSASPVLGPITNPANGHDYYLLEASTWIAAEAEAIGLGGHLVTINDAAEHDWVYSTELGSAHRWIGLTDSAHEGTWEWISGEPVTYTRWLSGEPNNVGGVEDYAESDRNGWNDVPNDGWGVLHQGIVEVVPDDVDDCPNSDLRESIIIDDCDSEVSNELFDDGCTMADRVLECAMGETTHGEFVSCVAQLTNDWKQEALISGREKGRIQSCAARGNLWSRCQTDAECDDGLFCNGVEICLDGPCIADDPCPGQSCDEAIDECID